MNFEDIKELLEIIASKNITEFELERTGVKIRISKLQPQILAAGSVAPALPQAAQGGTQYQMAAGATTENVPASVGTSSADSGGGAEDDADAEEAGLHFVKSPMVGTFYHAPSPNSPAYVKEGESISPGKVLCIVEAMKLMNEIESELSGTIAKVYVENGQPVEFGEKLFAVRPN